ncbi:competence/damage-inducible protein A [Pelagibacterium halotolerans]|uniref:competence/damage-inducible protein A n=1 Tax=Pelagibacterium halotolerans TaxID=531813 RepID=UPI00384FD250
MSEKTVTAALLVIGDEILSGRTKDVNINTTAVFCTDLGIELAEVRVVPDVIETIAEAINALRARYTYVFTTGGIGPTHDDITADAVAHAFDVDLSVNDEARAMLEARWKETGTEVTAARLRMARIPEGADLIVNAVSAAPGFRIGNVHVMAGVPVIMKAMLEAIAPTLKGGRKVESRSVPAGVGEGALGDPLGKIQERYPEVKIGSYPQMGQTPIMTYLVLRSHDIARLDEATAEVQALVDRIHAEKNIILSEERTA